MENNNTTVTPKFTFNMTDWNEWDIDCKNNFGDCRAIKAMSDHNFRKDFIKEFVMIINECLTRIDNLEKEMSKPKEETRKVSVNVFGTLAGGKDE